MLKPLYHDFELKTKAIHILTAPIFGNFCPDEVPLRHLAVPRRYAQRVLINPKPCTTVINPKSSITVINPKPYNHCYGG